MFRFIYIFSSCFQLTHLERKHLTNPKTMRLDGLPSCLDIPTCNFVILTMAFHQAWTSGPYLKAFPFSFPFVLKTRALEINQDRKEVRSAISPLPRSQIPNTWQSF
uniref:Uncharacterized protein n=1 Tax=Micrurus corallinus TaxID=54390 RepID=A0A2D4FQ00_MICCO